MLMPIKEWQVEICSVVWAVLVQWELLISIVLILIQLKIGLLEQEHTTIHLIYHQLHLKLCKKIRYM